MRQTVYPPESLEKLFEQDKVLTRQQVAEKFDCSRMTLWRALQQLGYLTSYNENARYYTLQSIPQFDVLGLWQYRKARFSRYGSLSNTIVGLVAESDAGYDARELSDLLGVQTRPELSRLARLERIEREKLGGAFVYVASDTTKRERQLRHRERQLRDKEKKTLIPVPEIVIAVLVELVKHPGLDPGNLARRLKRQGVPISKQEVENIFTRYELAGKKGP